MPSLSRELRRLLERTIAGTHGARQIAEDGAEQSLKRLAVDRHEPHTSLTPEERMLRNQLRAYGRQLGDKRDLQRGMQTIDHLKQAVAYEHWHRLLFARFLAENDLLMHPEHGVSLTLDEVKELALSKGCDWIELAAEYAQRMLLREVFRSDDPALCVPLSPEKRRDLEERLNSLPREIFLADDSLGWVYQFWQKDAKDVVNRSAVKIGADELAPVTQLFTEDYMVLFLLENTLGAWWTARHGASDLPGYSWTYLRLNEDGTPVSGTYDGWPNSARELKVLDPCMGSGHFLTFALPILARMRETEEGFSLAEAVSAVLRDNLFGLELDARCSQIAAFNLALNSWKLANRHFELPPLNLACSGLGINATADDWKALAGPDERQRQLMGHVYELFRLSPVLGSLVDPRRTGMGLIDAEVALLQPAIEKALQSSELNVDGHELAIAAKGTLNAFRILTSQFTLVATNVPYLGIRKQCSVLISHFEDFFERSRHDLATVFVDRSISFCATGGTTAVVAPQNWMSIQSYKKFREYLLNRTDITFIAALGSSAFEMISGEVVNVGLFLLTLEAPKEGSLIAIIDAANAPNTREKAESLRTQPPLFVGQLQQLSNPDSRIVLCEYESQSQLSQCTQCLAGIQNGDSPAYLRSFWEVVHFDGRWCFIQTSVTENVSFGGMDSVVDYDKEEGHLRAPSEWRREALHDSDQRGKPFWGQRGILISRMGDLPATLYMGDLYDQASTAIIPNDDRDLGPIFCYCSSQEYVSEVRKLDRKVNVTSATLTKVPYDAEFWRKEFARRYPAGLPSPVSSDPTQWIFDGHPKGSENPLQVGVARMLGYCWPRQSGTSFVGCPAIGPDGLERHIAADGIICLSAVGGEENAATRLRTLMQSALGDDYSLMQILAGRRSKSLEAWLRDEFFEEHCKLFSQRPFVWHVWDGLKDGFHALVNYHSLDRQNLEKLVFSYLGDWLTRQRQDVQNGVEGADTRLAASEHLQGELKCILEGEKPFDIFARWKPLDRQPIGWNPDLNDGIRVNIRPWITEAKLYKATKPGILRVTPNIKYMKDRGGEPARDRVKFPWLSGSTDRINDHHLSLAEKRRARGLS